MGNVGELNRTQNPAVVRAEQHTSRLADGISAVRQATREELRQGANQIKAMVSGGVVTL